MKNINIKRIIENIDEIINTNAKGLTLGICHSVFYTKKEKKLVMKILENWNEFSGDVVFPIPHPGLSPSEGYNETNNMWDKRTQYGKSRWKALFYLKEELKKMIKKQK